MSYRHSLTDGYTEMCAEAIVIAVEELRICKRRNIVKDGQVVYPKRPDKKETPTQKSIYYQNRARALSAKEIIDFFNSEWFDRYIEVTGLSLDVRKARKVLKKEGLI